jgi:hypothetical protein
MNATLALEVFPFVRNVTVSQGSVSVLEDGNILVGYVILFSLLCMF